MRISRTTAALRIARATALALLGLASPALAADPVPAPTDAPPAGPNGWELSLAPYLWGSGLEGTLSARGVESDFDVKFSDILDALDIGLLGAFEARYDRVSFTSNLVYLKLSTGVDGAVGSVLPLAPPGSFGVDLDTQMLIIEGMAGYEVARAPLFGDGSDGRRIAFDLRGGLRYWWLENELDVELDPGSPLGPFRRKFEARTDWVDFVVGGRVRAPLTRKLGLVVSGDVGGFDIGSSSKLTWSAAALLTYQISGHWQLAGGWRALDIDREIADAQLSGPLLGGIYRF